MRRPLAGSIAAELLPVAFFCCGVKIGPGPTSVTPQNFKSVTASVQTSFFSSLENSKNISRKARRSNRPQLRMFQVDVENFDNEVESYEIEAHNMAEAADIAQSRFGGEAYNMNIYDVCEF